MIEATGPNGHSLKIDFADLNENKRDEIRAARSLELETLWTWLAKIETADNPHQNPEGEQE